MFKKILLTLAFGLLLAGNVFAANTWYVRSDGGTINQCDGTHNAPYSGTGFSQPCAVSSLYYIIRHDTDGSNNFQGTTLVAGGDTVVVGDPGANPGQFMIGYNPSNIWAGCSSSYPYGCFLDSLPSGPDASHPTKLVGVQYATGCGKKTQLWGNERVKYVLKQAGGSNIDYECLDVTDHSACVYAHPSGASVDGFPVSCKTSAYPYGPWALNGIRTDSVTNLTMVNMDVHGLANRDWFAFRNGTTTLTNVLFNAAGLTDVDADPGSDNAGSPTNYTAGQVWHQVYVRHAGCGERYPLQNANISSTANLHNCFSQSQGGQGDGFGSAGGGGLLDQTITTWDIYDSDFSHNVQDGFDCLHCRGTGTIRMFRTTAEGNAGNPLKFNNNFVSFENGISIGNCGYFSGQAFTYNTGTFDHCRNATGDAIQFALGSGYTALVSNSSLLSNANGGVINLAGSGCDSSTHVTITNNISYAGSNFLFPGSSNPSYIYFNGSDGNGTGSCGNSFGGILSETYNIVYNSRNSNTPCGGSHDQCGVDPKFAGTIIQGPGTFYTADNYKDQLYLQSSSPARGAGNASVVLQGTSNDVNNYSRGGAYDIGAYEYGSVISGGAVCGNNVRESPEACDGNDLNLQTCPSQGFSGGTLTCLPDCSGYNTSACFINNCGNGNIDPGETCDTNNLNGASCPSLGFAGGSLACNPSCLSYNTSSCTGIVTPINYAEYGKKASYGQMSKY